MNNKIEFSIKDGYGNMDFTRIQNMLKDAFWSVGIKTEEVIQGSKNSALLVGAFNGNGNQIGFSRVISDKTRFAYILDVIVDQNYRRSGLGQSMIRHILSHPDLKDVYQWTLITKDAHEVYKKVGFNIISRPDDWMEIRHNRPDR
jgi:N-acetylglutamate synthase-like GNAT family acetyltransferase